ncbi:MAG TPA: hypothetical protein DEO32_06420 [Ruminococcaceae bacterium]|nr:hypothetical protein [Oscillospiraceae bacterium]
MLFTVLLLFLKSNKSFAILFLTGVIGVVYLQREITQPCFVFESSGEVMQAGWARRPMFAYNKSKSKSQHHCERDCYFINNGEVSLYLCVENYTPGFSVKIAIADLKRGGVIHDCVVKKFSFKKISLPEAPHKGELLYTDKLIQLQITHSVDSRILKCDFIDFGAIKNLYFNLHLSRRKGDSLNILAPFERNRRYFYMKRFEPEFTAEGIIRVGGLEYSLKENTSLAYFDSARFYKPRKHNYQRLGCDTVLNSGRISLNLASRVGDNRYGNENCMFIDGKILKLPQINVKGTTLREGRPFYFSDDDGKIDLTFKPFTLKGKPMNAVMDKSEVIFGRLFGFICLPDGEKLALDNAQAHLVFAEF